MDDIDRMYHELETALLNLAVEERAERPRLHLGLAARALAHSANHYRGATGRQAVVGAGEGCNDKPCPVTWG